MSQESRKLEFANSAGEQLAGRLEMPTGSPRAYALFAHCFTCSKDVVAASRISRALCARGYAVLRFDFTGLGNSEGDFANTNFSSNVEDLVTAADFLRREYRAPELLVGHSLGGAAVLVAASRIAEVKAVATIGAPSDPGHVRHLLHERIEAIEKDGCAVVDLAGRQFSIRKQFLDDLEEVRMLDLLGALRCAVMVMHSPRDEVVHVDHARRLYEAVRHPKSFVSLDDADHLLTRARDATYTAEVLAAWASRYVDDAEVAPTVPRAVPEGTVLVADQDSGYAQRILAGTHELRADEPIRLGGTDTGPNPYDLLLAALGACGTITMRMYARRKGWPLQHVAIRLSHEKIHARDCEECDAETGKVDRITKQVELVGDLDAEQRARLLEIADKCPVHRTLIGEKQVVTTLARALA